MKSNVNNKSLSDMNLNVNVDGTDVLDYYGNEKSMNDEKKTKLKKCLKVVGIVSASILGTFLAVVLLLQYVIFSPSRLKPMVEEAMADYVTCDYEIDHVELTYFSTFPKFGVQIEGLCLINPVEGSRSDTLMSLPKGLASVDLSDMLFKNTMTISKIKATDIEANIYIDVNGNPNYDVINMEKAGELEMPFDNFRIEDVYVTAKKISYVNDYIDWGVTVQDVEFDATFGSWDNLLKGIEENNVTTDDVCECLDEINKFSFTTCGVKFDAKLALDNPSDVPTLDMSASVDVSLPTLYSYLSASNLLPLPSDLDLIGTMFAEVNVQVKVQDLLDKKYENAKVNAELKLENMRLDYHFDDGGISVNLPYNRVKVETPALFSFSKNTNWLGVTFETSGGKIKLLNDYQDIFVSMSKGVVQLQLSNLLNKNDVQSALLSLKSNGDWKVVANGSDILVSKPSLYVVAEGNINDFSTLPIAKAEMSMDKVSGNVEGMSIDINGYQLLVNSSENEANLNLELSSINFNVPDEMAMNTENVNIEAKVSQQSDGILFGYAPEILASITGFKFSTMFLPEKVEFPTLNIALNDKVINVQNTKLKYGDVDFDILADVSNVADCIFLGSSPVGKVKLVGTEHEVNVIMEQFGDLINVLEPQLTTDKKGNVSLVFPLTSDEEEYY
jgi:hypothetical protein